MGQTATAFMVDIDNDSLILVLHASCLEGETLPSSPSTRLPVLGHSNAAVSPRSGKEASLWVGLGE